MHNKSTLRGLRRRPVRSLTELAQYSTEMTLALELSMKAAEELSTVAYYADVRALDAYREACHRVQAAVASGRMTPEKQRQFYRLVEALFDDVALTVEQFGQEVSGHLRRRFNHRRRY